MEKEKKFTYQGFILHSEQELLEAKKESEAIHYIRSQTDLTNVKVALKVYNRLIEKETLVTVLGVAFLKELREQLLSSGVVAESSLKPLPQAKNFAPAADKKALSKEQKLIEYYRDKSKNQMIIIIALCAVIAVMFMIRLFGTNSPFTDYEQKVLNEYGGWQDELTAKEQQLRDWEQALSERENALVHQEKQERDGSQNNAD